MQGFPGNETDVLDIGSKLSEVGINELTFNYSGTHQSEGDLNFETTQKDILLIGGWDDHNVSIENIILLTSNTLTVAPRQLSKKYIFFLPLFAYFIYCTLHPTGY